MKVTISGIYKERIRINVACTYIATFNIRILNDWGGTITPNLLSTFKM